eukprot:15469901-Alexandrium_andersonii.AAC.1
MVLCKAWNPPKVGDPLVSAPGSEGACAMGLDPAVGVSNLGQGPNLKGASPPTTEHQSRFKLLSPARGPLQA